MPTVSADHCFIGSEESEESVHASPCLVFFDHASEVLYAVAVSDKTAQPSLVEYAARVIERFGDGGLTLVTTTDIARDLQDLRRQVSAKRSAPTVPLNVPARESKGNGAAENAVRRWQGHFRTEPC